MPAVRTYTNAIPIYDIISKLIPGSSLLVSMLFLVPSSSSVATVLAQNQTAGLIAGLPVTYAVGVALQGYSGHSLARTQKFQRLMNRFRAENEIENLSELDKIVSDSDEIVAKKGEHRDRKVWVDIVSRFELPSSFLYTSSEKPPEADSNQPISFLIFIYPILYILDKSSAISLKSLEYSGVRYGAEQRGLQLARSLVLANQQSRVSRFSSLNILHRSMVVASSLVFISYSMASILHISGIYTETIGDLWFLVCVALFALFMIPIFFNGMIVYDESHDKEIIYSYYTYITTDD